jgi:hypothetical protein
MSLLSRVNGKEQEKQSSGGKGAAQSSNAPAQPLSKILVRVFGPVGPITDKPVRLRSLTTKVSLPLPTTLPQ